MQFTKETILSALDGIYGKALEGVGDTGSVSEFGEKYLRESNGNREEAVDSLIKWQITKNAANGFMNNLGGLITLPITLPVELTTSFYIQLRTIAAIAYLSGYDPHSDKVKTLCYTCLVGKAAKEILAEASIQIGTKITASLIASISGKTLTAINQAVGFRLITKFGETGVINLGKGVPLVGGAIGAAFEGGFTYYTAKTARNLFFEPNNLPVLSKKAG